MVFLAVALIITIIATEVLNLLFGGFPLGFNLPTLEVTEATASNVTYFIMVAIAATYIGAVGLKELIVERRFSVEFLMAVAGFGAAALGNLFLIRPEYSQKAKKQTLTLKK